MAGSPELPSFDPRPLKPFPGWYILVAWKNGARDYISDFASKAEAESWIAKNARAWLDAHSQEASHGLQS